MRLFTAIEIDEATRAQLAGARAAIESVLRDADVPPRLTWVTDTAAHVTLRFIGEVDERQIDAIQAALSMLNVTPFEVTWQTLGTFGGTRAPRVLWIAPGAGGDALAALAARVEGALAPLLGPGEARPFTPHLTIARVRDAGRGADWQRALSAVRLAPTSTRVTQVTLYQSRLSPKGPTYTAVSRHG